MYINKYVYIYIYLYPMCSLCSNIIVMFEGYENYYIHGIHGAILQTAWRRVPGTRTPGVSGCSLCERAMSQEIDTPAEHTETSLLNP